MPLALLLRQLNVHRDVRFDRLAMPRDGLGHAGTPVCPLFPRNRFSAWPDPRSEFDLDEAEPDGYAPESSCRYPAVEFHFSPLALRLLSAKHNKKPWVAFPFGATHGPCF